MLRLMGNLLKLIWCFVVGLLRSREANCPSLPWQNGHAERLTGSLLRECLDHVVVYGERHLRQLLVAYLAYYNFTRTHLSLNKDAPMPRAIQADGRIYASPILGGLHHQYVRI
jgi:Integrase core domain